MTTIRTERERKYDGIDTAALPDLDGLPGVAEISDPDVEELDAVYYDTPDLRLLAHGVTLRRRTGGHDAGWHLKLPVGPDERREIELPLRAGGPRRVPRALLLRTSVYARGAALVPVAHLHTHRSRTLLLDARQRSLAEIAQDAVAARAVATPDLAPAGVPTGARAAAGVPAGVPAGAGTEVSAEAAEAAEAAEPLRWTEVEAELVDGRPALLDAVEQRLTRAGLRRSASSSKLARALGLEVQPPPSPDVRPRSIGAAVTELLREQTAELIALDPTVRADQPDAVHQMRVAVRRLRSTLRIHRRLLDRRGPAGRVTEELRWLGAVLGEARDQEVLGARLGAELGLLPAAEAPGPIRERIDAWATSRYRSSWKRVIAELDGARYFALLDTLEELATRPPLRRRQARRGAASAFERTVRREQLRVAQRLAEAAAAPDGPLRDQSLHGARKAAKRARYAAEGAQRSVGKPASRLAGRMKAVQQLLGDRQDALLACAQLPGLASAAHAAGEDGFGYGVLYAGQRAAIAQTDRDLPAVWRAARPRRLTRFT
ncbi:CHAD domain-containing protein [Streptacidiphilus sp. EB129]|uniref:CYTH and CHAD domain-containing protein n=1 Tax=Streptacidiphilus sp. EB129 TaxID=3156262 RepID=UPI003517ADEB